MSYTSAIEFVASDAKSESAWSTASAGASATGLLVGLAAAKIALQFAGIRHYGFFRDELYYAWPAASILPGAMLINLR